MNSPITIEEQKTYTASSSIDRVSEDFYTGDESSETIVVSEEFSMLEEFSRFIPKHHFSFSRKDTPIANVKLCGLEKYNDDRFVTSYYIGTTWLDEEQPLFIKPKFENIDIMGMFLRCLHCSPAVAKGLDEIFCIHLEQKPIPLQKEYIKQMDPFLTIYFLQIVDRIVRKGLRKDYVIREENLQSKIKGRIVISAYARKDVAQKRPDRVYCRFQEYDIDCLDNRILKAAILCCKKILQLPGMGKNALAAQTLVNRNLAAFEHVSSDIQISDLNRVHVNPVFKEYKEAIKLASYIIKRNGFKTELATSDYSFPPFTINMALLFKRYVYSLLYETYDNKILFQEKSEYGRDRMDFGKTDEHLVIDTKYKKDWSEGKINTHDIRQLSGYSRNKKLRKALEIDESKDEFKYGCPCLIIYPDKNGHTEFDYEKAAEIEEYVGFKKIGIRLPTISS